MTEGRDVPWLQDTSDDDLWHTWNVTYRDVIIVDADSKVVSVFNVTAQDLAKSENYDALKAQLTSVE